MAKTISPFQIPSLDFEYDKGRLTTRSDPKYPPSAEINRRISLWKGDITKLQSDAIVNAANEYMRGGGGIDGAIHKAAGPDLLRELIAIAPEGCDTGKSIISQGHGLPARFIIHTVGPRPNSHGGDSEKLLRSCYETILQVAEANQVRSLALCGISTGIFGYPAGDAAHVACDVVRKFFEGKERKNVDKVVFVVYNDKDTNAYKQVVPQYFPRAT